MVQMRRLIGWWTIAQRRQEPPNDIPANHPDTQNCPLKCGSELSMVFHIGTLISNKKQSNMAIPMSILPMDFVHASLKRMRYSKREKLNILSQDSFMTLSSWGIERSLKSCPATNVVGDSSPGGSEWRFWDGSNPHIFSLCDKMSASGRLILGPGRAVFLGFWWMSSMWDKYFCYTILGISTCFNSRQSKKPKWT